MSLKQFDELLEGLVGCLLWSDQVTDKLICFSSTPTEENGVLPGSCVYVIGSEVLLQAFCVGDPVVVTLNKWFDCLLYPHSCILPLSPTCSIYFSHNMITLHTFNNQ